MKRLCLLFLCGLALTGWGADELAYRFTVGKKLNYRVAIKGEVSVTHVGDEKDLFPVSLEGILTLEPAVVTGETAIVEVIPRRTKVQFCGMTIEDFTDGDTVSRAIPAFRITMTPNGTILKAEDTSGGMISVAKFFNILPVFPKPELRGQPWKQPVPGFRFPLFPMPPLECIYRYEGIKNGKAVFSFTSTPIINSLLVQNGADVRMTGRNSSAGALILNPGTGEIESFDGTLDLALKGVYFYPVAGSKEKRQAPAASFNAKLPFSLRLQP